MPILKIGSLLSEGDKWVDAAFHWQENSTIDLMDGEILIGRFDPEDFLSLADAISAYQKRIKDAEKEV